MTTYRNIRLGFEIDLPDEWQSIPLPGEIAQDTLQFGCPNEAFNFVAGPLFPERIPEYTEREFRHYAWNKGYTQLEFGRIAVGGKEHVWARYFINDILGRRWNKKYMIVFANTEYTITATCNDPQWFSHREKDWDAIVATFRLLDATRREAREQSDRRKVIAGTLYEKAYQAVGEGRYTEARALLEQCIQGDPSHHLAHKEIAVVLRQLGDVPGALAHRRQVKRLDPSDTLNRANMVALLSVLGDHAGASQEIEELLELEPGNQQFLAIKAGLIDNPFHLAFPQHFQEESQKAHGKKCTLRLIESAVEIRDHLPCIRLVFQFDRMLSYEEAARLNLRASAYIACAIYDAALSAELFCRPFEFPVSRRPAWLVEDDRFPISLTSASMSYLDRTCQMEIGPAPLKLDPSKDGGAYWEKLMEGFKNTFSSISV